MSTSADALRERLEAAGQGHVFRFWDDLDEPGRARLEGDLEALDLALVERLTRLLEGHAAGAAAPAFEPPELFPLERTAEQEQRASEARARGAELLAEGRVGFVLVAGGQGSRLGFDGPKGEYPVGPLTEKSLFAWHAARLAAARAREGFTPTWYVMTSATNDAATRASFARNDWFGLGAENVFFFTQAMLPALTPNGEIVLAGPDRLFLAPNGHGGTLAALAQSGALADMAKRGIDRLSYFQVDNPLARPADRLFLGLHDLAGAEMSSKVVSKRDADEKVGVIGVADGKLGCIEYSDLPAELRHAKDGSGRLLFRAGNIAAHVIDRAFVERLTAGGDLQLPWHLARKKVEGLDRDGRPAQVDGVKFETFVFDALGFARESVTLEVARAHEFSPVKNADGEDSPRTCRRDMVRHFAALRAGSGAPAPPVGDDGEPAIEVDPCFAETTQEFRQRMPCEPLLLDHGHLYALREERPRA